MRTKITSTGEVFEGNPEQVLREMYNTADELKGQSFTEYIDGFVERLAIVKTYLKPPPEVRTSEEAYGRWMAGELMRAGRMSETDEPTTAEKKAEEARKKAEAAKAKAEAAAKKKAEAAAKKEAAGAKPEAKEPPKE